MKRQEIIAAVLNVWYIEVDGGIYSVYDPCGKYVGRCVWATAQRVLQEPTVKKIETYNGYVIANCTSRRASEIENREICKRYAEGLEQYADGMAHRCPHCGTENIIPEYAPAYCCEYCRTQTERDEWELLSLYDYLQECYDVEYRIGGDREYRSAEICLAWGGPNVYVDTAENAVKLFWGGERETYYISGSVSDEIDDICEEQYNCI